MIHLIWDCRASTSASFPEGSRRFIRYCEEQLLEGSSEVDCYFWKTGKDRQLPGLLKERNADLLMRCGLPTQRDLMVPEIVWIPEERMPLSRGSVKRLFRGGTIFTDTEKCRQRLLLDFPKGENNILLWQPASDIRQGPLSLERTWEIQKKWTRGKAYFALTGSALSQTDLIDLLKAFSLFKNRQQSNMQLIIAGRNLQMAPSFFEKLRTYRYREDVGIFNQLPESDLHEILAAAYGWIILPGLQHSVSFLNAFRLHVPVIAHSPKGGPGHEWGGDAALYADLSNHEQVADRLKLLYTDEKFRETMIRKGMVRDQLFSRENCMGQLMKGVRRCIKN